MNFLAGYKFKPTDKQLISSYLVKKLTGEPLPDLCPVKECDLYGSNNPWDIWNMFETRHPYPYVTNLDNNDDVRNEEEKRSNAYGCLYFFTRLKKRKKENKNFMRGVGSGKWNGEAAGKQVEQLGWKKMFTFMRNDGQRHEFHWIMHEYTIVPQHLQLLSIPEQNKNYVLCRIIRKNWTERKMPEQLEIQMPVQNPPVVITTDDEDNKGNVRNSSTLQPSYTGITGSPRLETGSAAPGRQLTTGSNGFLFFSKAACDLDPLEITATCVKEDYSGEEKAAVANEEYPGDQLPVTMEEEAAVANEECPDEQRPVNMEENSAVTNEECSTQQLPVIMEENAATAYIYGEQLLVTVEENAAVANEGYHGKQPLVTNLRTAYNPPRILLEELKYFQEEAEMGCYEDAAVQRLRDYEENAAVAADMDTNEKEPMLMEINRPLIRGNNAAEAVYTPERILSRDESKYSGVPDSNWVKKFAQELLAGAEPEDLEPEPVLATTCLARQETGPKTRNNQTMRVRHRICWLRNPI